MIGKAHFKEGIRIMHRAFRVRAKGLKSYSGSHKEICLKIVDSCYDKKKKYFMTSTGHFRQFYARDFGMCTPALLKLGYKKEVFKTLEYALSCYSRHGKITTQITPEGIPLDSFAMASDSLPFLLKSLRLAKAFDLVEAYKPFLEQQAQHYFKRLFDSKKSLIRDDIYISSMKDNYKRKSSCYDNCMLAMLSDELNKLNLMNPFRSFDFRKMIKKNFWNGRFFEEDLDKEGHAAGDANTFPFYCELFNDKKMLKSCIKEIRKAGLDRPFPLKYMAGKHMGKQLCWARLRAPNYEGSTQWIHLGLCYMYVVQKYDKKLLKTYLKEYQKNIEKYRNFLEVFNPDGTPYKTLFYYCDEGMSWAAMYLGLLG